MPAKSQPAKGKATAQDEVGENATTIDIQFSGSLTLLTLTPEEQAEWERHRQQALDEADAKKAKGDAKDKAAAAKGGKGAPAVPGPTEGVDPPELLPPAVLKEPFFQFLLPGEEEPRKTNVIDAVDFSMSAAHLTFNVSKQKVLDLGCDIEVFVMSNEPVAAQMESDGATEGKAKKGSKEEKVDDKKGKKDDKGKKDAGKKDKAPAGKDAKGGKGAAEPTEKYTAVARFVFNMANLVMGASSDTLVMQAEDINTQESKARQCLYGFNCFKVTCSLLDKPGPLLTDKQMEEWLPLTISVVNLTNMADNTGLQGMNPLAQEPDFHDLRQACGGVYAKYQLLPGGPATTTPRFTQSRSIGIHHTALFLLGDALQNGFHSSNMDGKQASTVLSFMQYYMSTPFEVEVHDRDPLEPVPTADSATDAEAEGEGDGTAATEPQSPTVQHFGRACVSLRPLLDGTVSLKASEQIVPARPDVGADEDAAPAASPREASLKMSASLAGFAREERVEGEEPPAEGAGAGADAGAAPEPPPPLPMIQKGQYLEWHSTISMKFVFAKCIPRLMFVIPPERALPWLAPEGAESTDATPEPLAATLSTFNPAPGLQCAECPLGNFTRAVVIIPYSARPVVLQTLLAALMKTPPATNAEADDVHLAAVPSWAVGDAAQEEDDKSKGGKGKPKSPAPTDKRMPASKNPSRPMTEEDPTESRKVSENPEEELKRLRQATKAAMWQARKHPVRGSIKCTMSDTVSGFEVLDGVHRIIVLEAIAEGGLKRVLDVLMPIIEDGDGVKVLLNASIPFAKREYIDWPPLVAAPPPVEEEPVEKVEEELPTTRGAKGGGKKGKGADKAGKDAKDSGKTPMKGDKKRPSDSAPGTEEAAPPKKQEEEGSAVDGVGGRIRRIRLRLPLETIKSAQTNYLKRRVPTRVLSCVDRLTRLVRAAYLRVAIEERMFPTTLELVDTERLYGQTLSNCDQSGDPFQIIIEGHPQELQPEGTQASAESELMALKRPITSTYTRTDWKEAEKPTYGPDTNLTELFGKEVRLMAWLLPEDPDVRPPSKELHNQWQYYESIHKKGRQQKLKEQGEDTGYCTSSDSEPEKDYDGHSDSVGLHEPRTFPAVTMNYCSVNRAKFAGSPKPAREFRTYTPPRVPKRDWETERGPMETRRAFKNLTQRTAQEDNAHRLRPSEQRIADLQEPWDPPTWPFDREDDRTGTFTVYAKPRSLELPPSVHINQGDSEQKRKEYETALWHSKVKVDTLDFKVRMVTKGVPDVLDKHLKGMLKDPPQKTSLRDATRYAMSPGSLSHSPHPPQKRMPRKGQTDVYVLDPAVDITAKKRKPVKVETPPDPRAGLWGPALHMSI